MLWFAASTASHASLVVRRPKSFIVVVHSKVINVAAVALAVAVAVAAEGNAVVAIGIELIC